MSKIDIEKSAETLSSGPAAEMTKSGVDSGEVSDISVNNQPSSRFSRMFDSFKRMELDERNFDPNMTEQEKIIAATQNNPLAKALKPRHLKAIAIGGCIGTGLFINTGKALRTAGPAGILIGWGWVGSLVYCTCQALGELTVAIEATGGFIAYINRFMEPSWGFASSWNYGIQWLCVLPLEIVAASLTTQFWDTEKKYNNDAWVAIFYCFIIFINLFPSGYGEAEFFFSSIKVITLIGFMILGIVINCGGAGDQGYIGGHYFFEPGPFAHSFKGVCTVFVSAAFSFAGVELSGLAAAENSNPKKALPKALKLVFYRIIIFYVTSLVLIGLLVPYDNPNLYNGSSSSISPFVLAIRDAGIKGLPSVMNTVIMLSVLSVGNASVFGCSRTLASLAAQGQAPKILAYVDRKGRPLVAIGTTLFFGLLSFVAASDKEAIVFDWLISISGLSTIFTWISINVSHIRFRQAMAYQGRSIDELSFVAQFGTYGSYYAAIGNFLILIAEFWISVWPIGDKPSANTFFQNYLTAPIVIAFYVGHKIWKRNLRLYIKVEDIDIDTGRRAFDVELMKQEIEEEKALLASKPWYYRVYKYMT